MTDHETEDPAGERVDIGSVPMAVTVRVLFDIQLEKIRTAVETGAIDPRTPEGATFLGAQVVTLQMLFNTIKHLRDYEPVDDVPMADIQEIMDATVHYMTTVASQFLDVDAIRLQAEAEVRSEAEARVRAKFPGF